MHRRTVVQYAQVEGGGRELRVYYGDKEISFDEPDLFAFGERLAKQAHFVAGSAADWGPGYPWPRVQALLEDLIDGGVLAYAADAPRAERADGARSSPLPHAPATAARGWDDCEARFAELIGRPLELGWLELVMPIFRVAHVALDRDGRQVGEANVFPQAMRIDVPTRWRTCIYDGTRHQVDRPMNVSALKGMRLHWGQMMAALLRVRTAYLSRFPDAAGGWTVGHLERLSTAVLAVPTYQLMRMDGGVANGDLHPALSSLFRVTDGLRMTMHQMLFVPIGEPTRSPDDAIDSAAIFDYAERNYAFHSEHGVCAGPRTMIEEFLGVLVDGRVPKDGLPVSLDPEVAAALDDVEAAVDYALLGLRAYAAVFSLWPLMAATYASLTEAVGAWAADPAGADAATLNALHERLRGHLDRMTAETYLASDGWRADRQAVYDDMDARCAMGLDGVSPAKPLTTRIAAVGAGQHANARTRLRTLVARRCGVGTDVGPHALDRIVDIVMAYLGREQRILGIACDVQQRINRLLGRADPARAFTATEIDFHNQLQGDAARKLPYLIDEIEALFDARITLDRDRLVIEARERRKALTALRVDPNSEGMGPFDVRANGTRPL